MQDVQGFPRGAASECFRRFYLLAAFVGLFSTTNCVYVFFEPETESMSLLKIKLSVCLF